MKPTVKLTVKDAEAICKAKGKHIVLVVGFDFNTGTFDTVSYGINKAACDVGGHLLNQIMSHVVKCNPIPGKLNDYGMGSEVGNRSMAQLEKLLREQDAALLGSALALDDESMKEVTSITDEAIESFKRAGQQCEPFQKFIVGVGYLIHAMEEMRTRGPISKDSK